MDNASETNKRAETILELKKRFRKLCGNHLKISDTYRFNDADMPEDEMVALWNERHEYLASLIEMGDRTRHEIQPTDFNNRILYRRMLLMELRARWLTMPGQAFLAEITSRLRESKGKSTADDGSPAYTGLQASIGSHSLMFRDFYYVGQTSETHYRDLRGIVFYEANLRDADMSLSSLEAAQFRRCDMRGALLAFSNLMGAKFHRCNIAGAKMWSADLRGAAFARCTVSEGDQVTSFLNIKYTRNRRYPLSIKRALLGAGRVATYALDSSAFLLKRFFGGKESFEPHWRKEVQRPDLGLRWLATQVYHTDAAALPTWESPLFKRYISDEQFLDAVRKTHPTWHWVWGVTSDCGRNWMLWAAWSQMIAMLFAFFYLSFPSMIEISSSLSAGNFFTYFYFSLVTFTTLGFGDIHAANTAGAIVVSIQVIIGYVFLGGLVAMLADKLARRA